MASDNPLEALKGNLVKNVDNEAGAIADDVEVIGIYFSAHWCPPCRGFTPVLAQYYNDMKAKGEKFEIVFLSSDRDEDAFKEYFKEMPWLALKFDQRDLKGTLSDKYGVRGIPTLVILNKDGSTKTTNGRGCVMQNVESKGFKWE